LRIANRLNFSLNQPFFILEAAHDTCTKTERRYLLPLVVVIEPVEILRYFCICRRSRRFLGAVPSSWLLSLSKYGYFSAILKDTHVAACFGYDDHG
jgi:hypothetical protein